MKSSFFARIATIVGLTLGAFAVSALAGTWTAPTAPAPGGNPDAPINAGDLSQIKTGPLKLLDLVAVNIRVTNPSGLFTGIPDGSVLIADGENTGKVKWGAVAGGSGVIVSQEYVLNTHEQDSQTVNMGVHKMCFLKGISGYETDSGRIGCYITTSTEDGSHTLNKWRAVCRAACID